VVGSLTPSSTGITTCTGRACRAAVFMCKLLILGIVSGLASCVSVPVIYDASGTKRVDFAAVVATFPEYKNAPLPQEIIPLTQQNIENETARLRSAALSNPRPLSESDQTYRVGVGDILNIVVWDHPELSFRDIEGSSDESKGSIVSPSGTIFYPYIGSVKVLDLTVDEIRNKLTSLLAVTIENPQLEVRVSEYRSKKAFVGGELVKPGLQKITDVSLTLIDAITGAGGATPMADLSNATLTRQNKKYTLNLDELFVHGGGALNITLQDEDVLTVPSLIESKYYVLGKVVNPTQKEITSNRVKLSEVVTDAGGVQRAGDEFIHNSVHFFVIRNADNGTLVFHLDRSASDALILSDIFNIKPNDIIYVANERPANWNLVYEQIIHYANLAAEK